MEGGDVSRTRFNQDKVLGCFSVFSGAKISSTRTDITTEMSAMVKSLPTRNKSSAKNNSITSKDE